MLAVSIVVTVVIQVITSMIILLCLFMFFYANWDTYITNWKTYTGWRTTFTRILDVLLFAAITSAVWLAPSQIDTYRFLMILAAFLWLFRCTLGYWLARRRNDETSRALFERLLIRYGLLWAAFSTVPALYLLGERALPAIFAARNSQVVLEVVLLLGPLAMGCWGLTRLDPRLKELLRLSLG